MARGDESDVPAAAFWTLATYWTFGTTVRSAVAAGVATSLAILIRPNLLPLAAVLAGWTVFSSERSSLLAFALGRSRGASLWRHRRHDLVVRQMAR
jgi:hypothetical protein